MIQDILNSIKVTLHERFSNPLLGTFLIAAAAFNYHFFLIIFSDEKLIEKFHLLEKTFDTGDLQVWLRLIIYPLLMTIFYIFILPYPSKKVYEFVRNRQKEILDIRRKTEDEFPLTQEEARILRSKHYELEAYYQNMLSERTNEVEQLKHRLQNQKDIPTSNDPKINLWDDEYDQFSKTSAFKVFKENVDDIFSQRVAFSVVPEAGILTAWGLIEQGDDSEVVPTEKGKYFARKIVSNEVTSENDLPEDAAQETYRELIEMIKTLHEEMNDSRRLIYNTQSIASHIEKYLVGWAEHLNKSAVSFANLVKKNISIINRIPASSRREKAAPYINELFSKIPKD
ncbi:hypothetical protein [Bdellovibrio sp. HCB-162]|uniref:hypothetical protein n=1 Tax=Bdellovibrio sp. HCB-162 TaxID=3394234 RepID=UPI0039BD8FA5